MAEALKSVPVCDESQKLAMLSIIVPAYNEAQNLPVLYSRLCQTLQSLNLQWELIVVDDHSSDETFSVISTIAGRDPHVKAIRLSRNYGSHTALTCGLNHAKGNCAVVLAADLQDPPEIIPKLMDNWRKGTQVVWAARNHREGEKVSTLALARLYYFLMRRFVGLHDMPVKGADFFLIDRCVIDALRQFNERNISIMALLNWMGFRQTSVTYDNQARLHGQTGWSLEKKLKLAVDSVTSFTYLPIRLMSYIGFLTAIAGFVYAGIVVTMALKGLPVQGWASLMVVVLVFLGIQMVMMGVLGEYIWRALDESRGRPRYLIEATTTQECDDLALASDNICG
jgi:dolichol-phosphate mannosyltransferase